MFKKSEKVSELQKYRNGASIPNLNETVKKHEKTNSFLSSIMNNIIFDVSVILRYESLSQ